MQILRFTCLKRKGHFLLHQFHHSLRPVLLKIYTGMTRNKIHSLIFDTN